jgi:hypothetical protein
LLLLLCFQGPLLPPAVLPQAIQAGQVTVEDHFMSKLGMHPLKVTAATAEQSTFGCLLCIMLVHTR